MEVNALNAHTPPAPNAPWHKLVDHLEEVANLAAAFGDTFGAADICCALGLAHDLGKANPKFQAYLRACAKGERAASTPHAAPGAAASQDLLTFFSLAVLAHHAGLYDAGDCQRLLSEADPAAVAAASELRDHLTSWPTDLTLPSTHERDPELLLRMCFSALVDADFLDTERHFAWPNEPDRPTYPCIGWYSETLEKHMSRQFRDVPLTRTNAARAQILCDCRSAANTPRNAFRLTVPTGGGKTLAGLTFAADHARHNGLKRVVVAIPYTSIIDQTAEVYRRIFGADNVLEHHSNVATNDTEGQSRQETRQRLAAENWDAPLVVTTTVQLFESIFGSRTSKCRKLHRIANSVIVLDEVQTLPPNLLEPILHVLQELIRGFGCSVVFCTATQPSFAGLPFRMLHSAAEIVVAPEKHFRALKRVDYRFIPEPITEDGLGVLISKERRCLCVLNTRKDAVRVAKALKEGQDTFHLSTLMCPKHRKSTLKEVRERLAKDAPVRLISTQVVEAGVDLDFPVVFRALGPLDRIIQAAGRCNREGRMERPGECNVFRLEGASMPSGSYKTGSVLAATVLREHARDFDEPKVVATYFEELYRLVPTDQSRLNGRDVRIGQLREQFCYRQVSQAFRLIPDETSPIVAYNFQPDRVDRILESSTTAFPRQLFRKLSPYTVSLPTYEFEKLVSSGLVFQHEAGPWIYTGPYSPLYGIGRGDEQDPADLIK